jgi:hypothetical protein
MLAIGPQRFIDPFKLPPNGSNGPQPSYDLDNILLTQSRPRKKETQCEQGPDTAEHWRAQHRQILAC